MDLLTQQSQSDSEDDELKCSASEILENADRMMEVKKTVHQKAKENIHHKQAKDKEYYDHKHANPKVGSSMCQYASEEIVRYLYLLFTCLFNTKS